MSLVSASCCWRPGSLSEHRVVSRISVRTQACAAGIVHRDIKLENILLTNRKGIDIKLADFGLSKCFEHDPLETMCGSPQYVSPEVLAMAEQKKGMVPPKVRDCTICITDPGLSSLQKAMLVLPAQAQRHHMAHHAD